MDLSLALQVLGGVGVLIDQLGLRPYVIAIMLITVTAVFVDRFMGRKE